jgi:hypothetical protein
MIPAGIAPIVNRTEADGKGMEVEEGRKREGYPLRILCVVVPKYQEHAKNISSIPIPNP